MPGDLIWPPGPPLPSPKTPTYNLKSIPVFSLVIFRRGFLVQPLAIPAPRPIQPRICYLNFRDEILSINVCRQVITPFRYCPARLIQIHRREDLMRHGHTAFLAHSLPWILRFLRSHRLVCSGWMLPVISMPSITWVHCRKISCILLYPRSSFVTTR